MGGLILNLKAYEKVLIGKVVIQNGARRTQMRVLDEDAGVLRIDDALHPDQVRTPLTRAYFAVQSLILDADPIGEQRALALQLLREACDGFSGFSMVSEIRRALSDAEKQLYYKALRGLKALLSTEAALLLTIGAEPGALTKNQP